MDFNTAFDLLMKHEGYTSNHPDDPGGATTWGVTESVARRYGYIGAMKDLPLGTAKIIARSEYWDKVRAEELPPLIRFDVFDTAYNSGVNTAIKMLQRSVGVTDDGALGPKTLSAVTAKQGFDLNLRFNAERLGYLSSLKNWPSFSRGWARRVASNMMTAAENR